MVGVLQCSCFIPQFAGYANSTVGEGTLDWENILQSGWNLVETVIRLRSYFNQYAPLFEKLFTLDITKVFGSLQNAFVFDPTAPFQETQNKIYEYVWIFVHADLILKALYTFWVICKKTCEMSEHSYGVFIILWPLELAQTMSYYQR